MGFLDAGPTDLFDFRFDITGGLLADQFGLTEDLGVVVTSEQAARRATGSRSITSTSGWGFDATDSFAAVFGRTVTGVTDLVSALKLGGGGVNALARHATAALLNAANPDVNAGTAFDTTAEVIAAFQAAYDSGDYEPTKDLFEASNESGCPLN